MAPTVGDPTPVVSDVAPDFELADQHRETVRLSSFRGDRAVVLLFYPFAFSGICGDELCSIRDRIQDFSNDGVVTLAVSTDSSQALRAWGEAEGFTFPLLSDHWPHGAVARRYGVFNEAVGVADRATFVLDRDGVVRFAVHNGIGEARDDRAYVDALRAIGAA